MFLLKQILPAAIIAMIVAACVRSFLFFWRTEQARIVLSPLALGFAYGVGHLFITGWVAVPPKDTTNWLPWFALVTMAVSAFCGVLQVKRWLRVLIFFLTSTGALRLLLRPKFEYGWLLPEGYVWVGALAVATVLVSTILDSLVQQSEKPLEILAFLLIICGGTFGVLILSGSVLLSQFAAVLGGAVVGSLVFTTRDNAWTRGTVPVFSLLLVGLLLSGYFFAELPATCAALVCFGPVLVLMPIRGLGLYAFPVRTALVSIPILIALVVAFYSSPPLSY